MITARILPAFFGLLLLPLWGCADGGASTAHAEGSAAVEHTEARAASDGVLTRQEQQALSPVDVLGILKAGNQRFVSGTITHRDQPRQVRESAAGQHPMAVVLSCLDSRIPVETVFDRGIGDLFVARVAGNFANTDIIGSMEFGCYVSGSRLVLVLGHDHCGAVRGAIDGVELGNITPMLANIEPAVDYFAEYEGEKTAANDEFVQMVAEQNVRMTIEHIRAASPILKKMESDGQIKIVGGMYDLHSGQVRTLDAEH